MWLKHEKYEIPIKVSWTFRKSRFHIQLGSYIRSYLKPIPTMQFCITRTWTFLKNFLFCSFQHPQKRKLAAKPEEKMWAQRGPNTEVTCMWPPTLLEAVLSCEEELEPPCLAIHPWTCPWFFKRKCVLVKQKHKYVLTIRVNSHKSIYNKEYRQKSLLHI